MNRRRLLKATAGFAVLGLAMPRAAFADAALRRAATGAANAAEFGLEPNAAQNQTAALQALLERASAEAIPIFLPPGRYRLSDLALPRQTRLFGVPGATHLEQDNLGSMFTARAGHHLALSGLAFDGRLMPPSGSGGGPARH
ncbi:glycosyl hydrolase family 28-related protein [Nitratireductor sp. GISD-1A_MAKvit]|uniref:glycosyl hydrolase family 28-related protein n=1 Tax=Nitratireductor sp. GISD-1A_MAKvit TaxID=3234198 RepID=UPI0034677F71